MMKHLFKNSFFTFLKSKVAMILLAILIFLSTATFTLLSSTSNAFKNSYNQVITHGKLHDFTVKQKYSIDGQLHFKINNAKKDTLKTTFDVLFDDKKSTGSYKNNEYINTYNKIISEEFARLASSTKGYTIVNTKLGLVPSSSSSINVIQEQILNSKDVAEILIDIKNRINKYIYDNFENDFRNIISNQYGTELYETKVKSIVVNSNKKLFKVINGSHRDNNINEIVIFQGKDVPIPLDEDQLKLDANRHLINLVGPGLMVKGKTTTFKGYRATAYYDKTYGKVYSPYSYIDPSSLMAVVSPSYFNENNLQIISIKKVKNIYEEAIKESGLNDPFGIIDKQIKNSYSKYVVWVDFTPYFIVGVGTTPDFSFPIINQENPIPDIKNQANIFVNNHGYKRIEDAFRNNPRENYISYRFKEGVSKTKQEEISNFIEKLAHQKMSWGKNISHIVSKKYDTTEKIIMAPHRVSTINNLQKTINVVSYATLTLLVLFVAFVVILVIKRQINANKKTFGILLANGYSKKQIALSSTSIALIIGLVSTIFGYIVGNLLQPAFILIFKNYWTLPVSYISFDLISLMLTVALPMMGIVLLAFVITIWEVRGPIPNIISGALTSSRNLSAKVVAPLKWIGIKLRISLALFFTNLSKMFLIFISAAGTIIAISTSLSTYNKFNIAKTQSLNSKNYEYKLDLANPTSQGGLMKMMPIEEIGVESISHAKNIYDSNVNFSNLFRISNKKSYGGHSKFMIPNLDDQNNSKTPFYLDGLIQVKSLLNIFAGLEGFGVGPWQTAEKIMPENQLNQANKQYNHFINFAAKINKNLMVKGINGKSLTEILIEAKYLSIIKDKNNNDVYTVEVSNFNKISSISTTNLTNPLKTTPKYKALKEFVFNGLKEVIKIYNDPNTPSQERLENMPFFISYRNIISNKDDETFTRIEGDVNLINNEGIKVRKNLNIVGIKPNTKFIKFNSESSNKLKSFGEKDFIPVIVNRFFLFKYDKEVGDTFSYTITNHKDRFNDDFKSQLVKLKIIGIHDSYSNSQLYTLQNNAIKALGWDINNKEKSMFNGVFTKHKNSILFKSVSLYSLSGLYPSTDAINKETDIAKNINTYLKINPIAGATNLVGFEKKFTLSPYVMVYKNVNWQYTEQYRFDSLLDISSKLIYIVESIMLTLAILFVLIISLMMIFDNKKFISTMKVMGYRKKEISKIFFISFVPTIVFGFFVAAPISFGISVALKTILASYGEIFIPISLTWWTLIISAAITFLVILFVYILSSKELRKINLQQAFE